MFLKLCSICNLHPRRSNTTSYCRTCANAKSIDSYYKNRKGRGPKKRGRPFGEPKEKVYTKYQLRRMISKYRRQLRMLETISNSLQGGEE